MANNNECCKYLMFFFNLLIFLAGAALLGVGIWVLVGADSFRQIISDNPAIFNSVYIIIAVGALLLIVGFLGCCGAIKENKCLLGTFFFMVLIIFILEIAGGVIAFVFYPDAKDEAIKSMSLYNNPDPAGLSIKSGWDTLQQTFECCGYHNVSDWNAAGISPIPSSCPTQTSADKGCEEAIQGYFTILGGIAIGVLFVEILAMIFACCLYQNVSKDRYA